MAKYTTIKLAGVITRIAVKTETEGYTEGILETFYPSDEQIANMTNKELNDWIATNNKRMELICDFLNSLEK